MKEHKAPWTIIKKHHPRKLMEMVCDPIPHFQYGYYVEDDIIYPYSNLVTDDKRQYPLNPDYNFVIKYISWSSYVNEVIVARFDIMDSGNAHVNNSLTLPLYLQCDGNQWRSVVALANHKRKRIDEAKAQSVADIKLHHEKWVAENDSFEYNDEPEFEKRLNKFYRSSDWTELKEAVFNTYENRCKVCHTKKNLVADHIHPVRYGWGKRLDLNNMQILCKCCNMEKGSSRDWDLIGHRKAMKYRRGLKLKPRINRWGSYC